MLEITNLVRQFGPTVIQSIGMGSEAYWTGVNSTRTSEVCMVIRRPSGRLLTFTKTFYPPGVYRLLTGGIEPGETVLDALHRELAEETGLAVEVRRLLTVVHYYAENDAQGSEGRQRFTTFAFLLDEVGGILGATDEHERVAGYREIALQDLPAIAEQLDRLPGAYTEFLGQSWRDWGRFRAVIHRQVWETLR